MATAGPGKKTCCVDIASRSPFAPFRQRGSSIPPDFRGCLLDTQLYAESKRRFRQYGSTARFAFQLETVSRGFGNLPSTVAAALTAAEKGKGRGSSTERPGSSCHREIGVGSYCRVLLAGVGRRHATLEPVLLGIEPGDAVPLRSTAPPPHGETAGRWRLAGSWQSKVVRSLRGKRYLGPPFPASFRPPPEAPWCNGYWGGGHQTPVPKLIPNLQIRFAIPTRRGKKTPNPGFEQQQNPDRPTQDSQDTERSGAKPRGGFRSRPPFAKVGR